MIPARGPRTKFLSINVAEIIVVRSIVVGIILVGIIVMGSGASGASGQAGQVGGDGKYCTSGQCVRSSNVIRILFVRYSRAIGWR